MSEPRYDRMSERLLFKAKWSFFQLYYGENKLHSMTWWWCSRCTRPTQLIESLYC